MENIINSMVDYAIGLLYYFGGALNVFLRAVDGLTDVPRQRIRRYLAFLFYGTIFELLLLILGVLFRQQEIVVFAGGISVIMIILIYLTILLPAQIFNFLTKDVLNISRLGSMTEAVRSALFPVLSAAFFVACLSSIVASRGFVGISYWTIVVYAMFILVLIVFSLFFKEKSLTAHIMVLLVATWYLFVYMFPIPTKSLVLRIENKVNGWSLVDKDSSEGQIVIIPKGAQRYSLNDNGSFSISVTQPDSIRAKAISIEEDYNSGERLYKVVLSNKQGEYIAGEITYVSVRSVLLLYPNQDSEILSAIEVANKKKSVPRGYFEVKKGERMTIFSCSDNYTVHFESDGPFSLVERTSYDYDHNEKKISKPKGRTSHYFTWGGSIEIEAKDNIIIKAW